VTATVREFCRINGLDEKSENLVELIFEALTGGDDDKRSGRDTDAGEKVKAPVSDGAP